MQFHRYRRCATLKCSAFHFYSVVTNQGFCTAWQECYKSGRLSISAGPHSLHTTMTTPNRRPRKFKPPGSWDGPPSPTGWGSAPQWANNNDGWGSPAPMSRPQPGPHVCNCSVLKHTSKTKVADNSAQPSDSDEEQEEPQQPFDGIVDRKEHYLIREQIWCADSRRLIPRSWLISNRKV